MIKYLIFGNGYMGNKFYNFLNDSIISTKKITSQQDVLSELRMHQPKIAINCIGKTGRPNVDWCENHKAETMEANVIVPYYIAMACQNQDVMMVNLGTGCIYDGDNDGQGFSEEDEPNFFGSYYSRTKIISQKMLSEFNVMQLRIRMPLDDLPNERNLITKLLSYKKIINIPNSASYIPDMLQIAKELMDKKETGIFNLVNKGSFTHEEILSEYSKSKGINHAFERISLAELDKIIVAKRSNCVLSTKKIEDMGIKVPDIKDAIRRCVKNYVSQEAT